MKTRKIAVFLILAIFVCVLAGCSTIQSTLDVPENLHVENGTVRWNSVDGAMKYLVFINGNEESSNGTSFDLSSLNLVDGETYTVKVKAVGDGYVKLSSEYSEEISFIYDGSNTNAGNGNLPEEEEPIIEEGAYSQFTDINKESSYLGYGYDIINSKYMDGDEVKISYPIIDLDKLSQAKLKIAKNLKNSVTEVEAQTMEEFSQKYGASLNMSGGVGIFSGSLGFNYKGSETEKAFYYFYMCSYIVKTYNIYLTNTMDEIKDMLSDDFLYDLKNMEASQLFKKYGTHMIRSASMGGRLDVCATYSSEETEFTMDISAEIKADIKAIYSVGVGLSGNYSEKINKSEIKKETSVTQVGGASVDIVDIETTAANRSKWFESFSDINNSALSGVVDGNSLVGIWELLPAGYEDRATELENLYSQLCLDNYDELCSKYKIQGVNNTRDYAGGDGTKEKPYLISNATHLKNIELNPTKYFELIDDIEMLDDGYSNWVAIGGGDANYTAFSGHLDGKGKKIKGLTCKASPTYDENKVARYGLFALVNGGATIKNLVFEDVNIIFENPNTKNDHYILVGVLCGQASDCEISCIGINGNINCSGSTSKSSRMHIGGLVGEALCNVKISYCYNKADMTATHEVIYMGGICGNIADENTIIKFSYYRGEMICASGAGNSSITYIAAGGIVGGIQKGHTAIVQQCYTKFNIRGYKGTFGYNRKGGVVGLALTTENKNTVKDNFVCYYLASSKTGTFEKGNYEIVEATKKLGTNNNITEEQLKEETIIGCLGKYNSADVSSGDCWIYTKGEFLKLYWEK